ncbi:OmpA family protein [Spirosoma sp. KNUC1025]|uniref:OmpA family protein n=1 Tax=Spirosoma sp. KNUC1025 TaxID=2894082 RepID=UPI003868B0DC|nr:OmpA family protein [Spirosoma sp. KNUC1025]
MICQHATAQVKELSSSPATPIPQKLPLSITILYFDQSSHQLRPHVKIALDSIALELVRHAKLRATVTGYTDNVGKRELNLVLAEQRAKTVEHYLRKRGVAADKIITRWEGPDSNVATTHSQGLKTISRRVIIQLASQ